MVIPGPNSEHTAGASAPVARGEFAAIERIRQALRGRLGDPPPSDVWMGDDSAVLGEVHGRLLLTTDVSVAGVHGDLEVVGIDDFGWKAMVAALSDIAAMGGDPTGAVVGVAGPPATDLDVLYEGIGAAAASHGCPVVGGDLSTGTQLVVSVAVTGSVDEPPAPVLRSGASPGDSIFVVGKLGASAAGLRVLREGRRAPSGADPAASLLQAHLRPRALLAEGGAARRAGATAMIDVSDGLAADLGHLAAASGIGFELDDLPVAEGATAQEALGGGEDYALVVAVPFARRLLDAFAAAGLEEPVRVGVCTEDPARRNLRGAPVTAPGFEHPWA
ncbi:MAG TPA: thiamine-phosphate kinase [Acidimicrobiales bacterium]|nr:thiamine-phosphate kinase [Acidimicrobiales bacterium]